MTFGFEVPLHQLGGQADEHSVRGARAAGHSGWSNSGGRRPPARRPAAGGSAATAADTAAITQLAKTYEDAYNKKDVAGVAATYESDATVLESSGKLVKGMSDITAALAADTANWAHLVITPVTPYQISGDMAVSTGTTATHVPGPGGQTLTIPARTS